MHASCLSGATRFVYVILCVARRSMIATSSTGAGTWLLSLPPTRRQTQWVLTVAVCQLALLALVAPFGGIPLGQMNGFIPAVEAVIFVTDLFTSVLLFSQFATHRLSALLVLACGYLFSALIIIPHALSFPGAFAPVRLPGAGLQTTPWLYVFWHFVFAIALLGYGLMRNKKSERGSSLAVIVRSVALVVALVCGLVLVTTVGHDHLPPIFADSVRGLPANELAAYALPAIATPLCASALAVLWLRRRSVLDQWVMIVALAQILEVVIVVLVSPKRFDVGFYAGRLFSLITSTIVMAVLLVETMRLYADDARSKEGKLRRLVDSNIVGICIFNLDRRIVDANDAFLTILGYDSDDVISGRLSFSRLTPPEWVRADERLLAELVATGTWRPCEKELFRKDGSRVPVLVGGATFGELRQQGVAFVLDLTERKRAETELAHANRVATIGQLSASIAHEVNQPIAALLTNAETAVRWLAREPPNLEKAKVSIGRIISDGKRAGDIVSRIRDFSKKAPVRKEILEVNEVILDIIGLTSVPMSNNGVVAKMKLAEGLPYILGDRVQLQQVILNLIMNAIEAMSEAKDGQRELLVSTSEVEFDGLLVAVSDTGPGLSQVSADRIFEPFYTTKSSGLGMGLSICRSIVEAHGGRLWAKPNEPHGALFCMVLPIGQEPLGNRGSAEDLGDEGAAAEMRFRSTFPIH
jgi:PAS domain S-box-containing protein